MAMSTNTASVSFAAIGTSAVLKVTDPDALEHAHSILQHELARLDRTCSRFRPDSDLVRVGRNGGRWTCVDPLLIEGLGVALRAAELTEGDLDPTVGEALVLAGYDRDWGLIERSAPTSAAQQQRRARDRPLRAFARRRKGWLTVELDRERSRVRVPSGIQLDLGATAKAWAADRACNAINQATGSGVLVSLGGDIATAGESPVAGWRIHVTDDHRSGSDAPGQTVAIASGGLATSSVTVRRWRRGERDMHHIIDPSTGTPAGGPWRTVSAAAMSCLDANIATAASLVRGPRAVEWLQRLGLPARLVRHDGRALTIGGWPAQPSGQSLTSSASAGAGR